MIFYKNLLPTEIWFLVYKIEHSQHLKLVNDEIKQIYEELHIINIGAEEVVQGNPRGQMVNYLFDIIPMSQIPTLHHYISIIEIEQQQGGAMHWFERISLWSFINYISLRKCKKLSPDQEFTMKRILLLGNYLWNGPLFLEPGTCDLKLKRDTINKELMMTRYWSDRCYARPNLIWQGRFSYRPDYVSCGEEMWRYLDTSWRGGQMHGLNMTQHKFVKQLEASMGRKPTPSEVLAKSIDMIHKRNLNYLFPPNQWNVLEYESSDEE